VGVFGESLVVEAVRKHALLGLEPDVLDGVVKVVAEEEAVELVDHVFGEQVLIGRLVEDAGTQSLMLPAHYWVLSHPRLTKSTRPLPRSSFAGRSTRLTPMQNRTSRVHVLIISPINITPINLNGLSSPSKTTSQPLLYIRCATNLKWSRKQTTGRRRKRREGENS
jgi:hypothetical protein